MEERKSDLIQLWMNHSNFYWEQVRAIPFIAAIIFGGAYKLHIDGSKHLSIGVLSVGAILFAMIALMMNRHRQWVDHLTKAAEENVIPQPGKPLFGLKSNYIGTAIPVFMLIVCLLTIWIFQLE